MFVFRKYLMAIVAVVATVLCLASCSNEDGAIKHGDYKFFEPCMQWGANVDQVCEYMSKIDGWGNAQHYDEEWLLFSHPRTSAQMYYRFGDEGLAETQIYYYGCNYLAPKMKSDWTKELGLTWTKYIEKYELFKAVCELTSPLIILASSFFLPS